MRFFDVLDSLQVGKELVDCFSDTEVVRFTVSNSKGEVSLYLTSDKYILPSRLHRMERLLERQLYAESGMRGIIYVSYPFAYDYGIEKIWRGYSDYLFEELSAKGHILYDFIKSSYLSFDETSILLSLDDNPVFRGKENDLTAFLTNVYAERFNTHVVIKYNYVPVPERKADEEPVYEYTKLDYVPSKPDSEAKNNGEKTEKKTAPSKTKNAEGEGQTSSNSGKSSAPEKTTSSNSFGNNNGGKSFEGKKFDYSKKNGAYDKSFGGKAKRERDPDLLYGNSVEGQVVTIASLEAQGTDCVIEGEIIKVDENITKNGNHAMKLYITDFTDSICVSFFLRADEHEELIKSLKVGNSLRIKGIFDFDTFIKETVIKSLYGMKEVKIEKKKRMDNAEKKRIELHAHTKMSEMDAVVEAKDLVKTAFDWGHKAVAITDHGVVYAFPDAFHAIDPGKFKDDPEKQKRAKEFKIIYGCEAYLVDDEPDTVIDSKGHSYHKGADGKYSDEDIMKMPMYHTIILCKNTTGRVNLYELVSDAHLKYYRRRPRIPKSLLRQKRDGLIVGSACEAGELYRAILFEKGEEEINRISSFYDYYEIQPLGNNRFMIGDPKIPQVTSYEDLIEINKKIIELGRRDNKNVVATCDSHFLNPEDEIFRRILMAAQKYEDADNQAPLYFRTTEEMLKEFDYLDPDTAYDIVVEAPERICDMIDKITPVRPDKCPPVIPNSEQTLRDICYDTAHSIYGEELPAPVAERLEHELKSIIGNGYAVMYIIAQKLVWKSNDDGYVVGSRGSVGSSFVATMSKITEINPLPPHYYCEKCHFSDFDSDMVKAYFGSSGFDMPDRDCPVCGNKLKKEGQNIPFETFLGFLGDKEPDIDLNFSGEYQSHAHDYTEVIFGKGCTFRAGTISGVAEKTAFGYVKKYYEDHGVAKRPAETERIAHGVEGVRKTTGQHPGGIVVMPHGESIYSFTPVQRPANDVTTKTVTTHFDYHSIDHNLLKLDILGHDDPTMIRMLEDITGIDAKKIPMDDAKAFSLLQSPEALGIKPEDIDGCPLGSLGLPELGTDFVIGMLLATKPKNFSDTIRISGLSHGTDVWLNNTQQLIEEGKCTLSNAICTRDDIMVYLIHMQLEPALAFKIMESVRKGRGLTPEMEAAMREKDVPDWYIWSCKKIKYMFPKAHAAAYVMMAFRIAHFKIYYPLAYYAAFFSIRATAFSYEKMCLGRPVLDNYMAELRSKQTEKTISAKELDALKDSKIVQEMYARGFSFHPLDIYRAHPTKFQIIDGKLMPSLTSLEGLGEVAANSLYEAAKKERFLSREDLKNRGKIAQSTVDKLNELGLLGDIPETNQFSLNDFFSF